jgi:predicted FMN-binding regulatory protein PaiB
MYQPPHFREDRLEIQHGLIRAHPLGLLISTGADGPVANAIPFLIDSEASPKGTLRGHLARANPQWRDLEKDGRVLIVFQGAQTYVTPSWYATKRETGKVVPTWNYAIVQVRGMAKVIDDRTWLAGQVASLTGHGRDGDTRRRKFIQLTSIGCCFVRSRMLVPGNSALFDTLEDGFESERQRLCSTIPGKLRKDLLIQAALCRKLGSHCLKRLLLRGVRDMGQAAKQPFQIRTRLIIGHSFRFEPTGACFQQAEICCHQRARRAEKIVLLEVLRLHRSPER